MNRNWVRSIDGKGPECPVCKHKGGCWIGQDAVFCIRVQDGCARRRDGTAIVAKDGMGWLHRMGGETSSDASPSNTARPKIKRSPSEWEAMAKRHREAMTPARLAAASTSLGLSERSLSIYGVGYDVVTGCLSFPMFDGSMKTVGLRLRRPDEQCAGGGNRYRSVLGSANGLFVPADYEAKAIPGGLTADPHPLLLLLPEGPTDCCAARDLGFRAIGRPSNKSGAVYARKLLEQGDQQEVVVVADHDKAKFLPDGTPFWPGWEGALSIAEAISPVCGQIKVMRCPGEAKDMRQYLAGMGTAGLIMGVLGEAQAASDTWIKRQWQMLADAKDVVRAALRMKPEAEKDKVLDFARDMVRKGQAKQWVERQKVKEQHRPAG